MKRMKYFFFFSLLNSTYIDDSQFQLRTQVLYIVSRLKSNPIDCSLIRIPASSFAAVKAESSCGLATEKSVRDRLIRSYSICGRVQAV